MSRTTLQDQRRANKCSTGAQIPMNIIIGLLPDNQCLEMQGTWECNLPLFAPSCVPTSNSMKHALVCCGPNPPASTLAVPKVHTKQRFNAHPALNHNLTMVVTLRHHTGNISFHLSRNAAEPRPRIVHTRRSGNHSWSTGSRAADMCACTSCTSALLSLWIRSQRLQALRYVDYPCIRRLRSLTLLLNSFSPKSPQAHPFQTPLNLRYPN